LLVLVHLFQVCALILFNGLKGILMIDLCVNSMCDYQAFRMSQKFKDKIYKCNSLSQV
jgi:hypothetical protein